MDSEPESVPWPLDSWNEIIPNLWQGGQIAVHGIGAEHPNVVRVTTEFDAVYSFFWRDEEGNGPNPGFHHEHCFIPDGDLAPEELDRVKGYAVGIAQQVRDGIKVLVRCQAGYNRSGLVTALALLELGYGAEEAIALIREKRSPHALHRLVFQRYIREEEAARDSASE
jgi:hypothetical protein